MIANGIITDGTEWRFYWMYLRRASWLHGIFTRIYSHIYLNARRNIPFTWLNNPQNDVLTYLNIFPSVFVIRLSSRNDDWWSKKAKVDRLVNSLVQIVHRAFSHNHIRSTISVKWLKSNTTFNTSCWTKNKQKMYVVHIFFFCSILFPIQLFINFAIAKFRFGIYSANFVGLPLVCTTLTFNITLCKMSKFVNCYQGKQQEKKRKTQLFGLIIWLQILITVSFCLWFLSL